LKFKISIEYQLRCLLDLFSQSLAESIPKEFYVEQELTVHNFQKK
jgi:hypothetical protein